MAVGADTQADYAAFISYNHKDVAAARRLQRRLESYRLPKGLAGPDGARRLGSVFRDRDELPAAADLSEAVREGLSRSRALVVLCSPNAATSPWVDKEVRLFRELHPDRPIFAAIVDGEPEEAFPPALRSGPEPLAADLRPQGDGVRLGTLKLVAGLAAVGLDRLIQRDAQRRIRRVTSITVAALIVMLGFIALSVFAWRAQREAERQRAEAEGIVEFMLTDLRQRLRSVGRLDALTVVNDRAMNYYRSQGDLARLPEDSLERRARVLHAMGEDDITRGDLKGAARKFTEAHRTTEAILAASPEDPERIFAHSQSEFWVGYAAQLNERVDDALKHYRGYLHWAHRLSQIEPGKSRSFVEMGYALSNIAAVQSELQHKNDDAIVNYQKSLYWFEQAQKIDPKSVMIRMEVAERHARISDVQLYRSDLAAARWHRTRQLELLIPLRNEDPENGDIAYDTLVATRALARIASEGGELARADQLLQDAKAQSTMLRARDPENQNWFEQHLRILMDAAELARARHREAEMARLVGQARRFIRESSSKTAADPAFRAESIKRLDAMALAGAESPGKGKDDGIW